jgi:uncharacterized protein YkwD
MMIGMHRAKSIIAGCIAAWALVACGGSNNDNNTNNSGGSSSGGSSTGFSGQDASAPALTNNVAIDGRNWINYRRTQIGMPTLTLNTTIDRAAQGHSDYQRINNVVTHEQTSGKQGFTGVTLADRLKSAGYSFSGENRIGEVISATTNQTGFYMAEELITAIYHRFVIFEPVFKEIGSGAASTSAGYIYFTANFVTNAGFGPGLADAGAIATWPFSGQTGVPVNFLSDYEEPDPVPDLNEVGYPVSVHTNLTRKLTVQSFTIRARNGSTNLQTRLLVKGQDANTTTESAAAIVPLAPLAAATTYDVSFNGAIDGVAVSKTWSFTTK